jgi:tetratricopeptide (TPR) repeat protein
MAKVVLGFLRDASAAGSLDAGSPVNVLELAAGSGQFAFSFLRSLRELKDAVPGLAPLRVRYVMTDLAQSNVTAWRAHERLRPFVEEGLLDFARFDLEDDAEVRLLESGEALDSPNPLVVLANYAFDSTRQDCFQIHGRTITQNLVTTTVAGEGAPDLSDPAVLECIRLQFEAAPMAAAYYEDALSNRVLEGYRKVLGDTTFLFPVGAIDCLRRLLALCGERMFLLCGDKGAAHEEQLKGRGNPIMTLHGACFSFIVNLNAIGHYFEEGGGLALHAARAATGFQVSAFLAGFGASALPETRHAFAAEVDHFGPVPFFTLVKSVMRNMPAPPLDVLLALLELCEGDPEVLYAYCDVLRAHARAADATQRQELRRALGRAWDGFYPLHKDLAFELARISVALSEHEDARAYCQESLRLFGPTHGTLLVLAYCHSLRGDYGEGLRAVDEALALKPDSEPALDLRARLRRAPARS